MSDKFITVGLAAVFTALVGFIVGVEQLGRHAMYDLHMDAQHIAQSQWLDVEMASQALEYADQNLQITVQVVLSDDRSEIKSLLARRTSNSAQITALLTRLQTRVGSEAEQECLNSVLETRREYSASYGSVSSLVLNGKRAEAEKFLVRDTFPSLLRNHAAFRRFYDFQTDEMNMKLNQSTARYIAARRKASFLMAVSAVLGVCIAGFVLVKLTLEIRSRTQADRHIKDLNAELETKVKARTLELESTVAQLHQQVQEREQAEEQVHFLAYYDALTDLPNRSLLQHRLNAALGSAKLLAVLFLDLDHFKNVNDSLGHSVGDLLLKEVAARLKTSVRGLDAVARLGGDEFVIVLSAIGSRADAAATAARLVSEIAQPFSTEGFDLSVTCSVGISLFPEDAASSEELLKNADAAMYSAKENGRNGFQFFTAGMNGNATRKLTLQTALRHALERRELFLLYQPQVDISSGEIVGAEALLRWNHPELGLIPPGEFIPIAESIGLIIPIGDWVLRQACAQAKFWNDQTSRSIPVSVNVSPLQFRRTRFPQLVKGILSDTSLSPECLELELTEGLILSSADVVMRVLNELKGMRVRLSIDDFGTGYSNLGYLRQFPIYKLKIDRMFVKDVLVNPDDAAITDTIINMAKTLHLRVIAEGVESEEQVSFLRSHGCDEFQGFYFSKPLNAEDFLSKLLHRIEPTKSAATPDGSDRELAPLSLSCPV